LNKKCKPFRCSAFFPNGAIFCHVCGGKYSKHDLEAEAKKPPGSILPPSGKRNFYNEY